MPCYSPLKGYESAIVSSTGGRGIVFRRAISNGNKMEVPCGQCIGCRLERSRQWAIRCVHEASLHKNNCFITLTYDEENLPSDGSLHKHHFQKFIKRLRKKYGKLRFFHCGEYGEENRRPHYHACIFGLDFDDKVLYTVTNGHRIYESKELEKIWGKGFVTVGELTFETAAYTARYITKKINGPMAERHYENIDKITGEIHKLEPEYITMSRRPGIGKNWLEKFETDVFPENEMVINGRKMKPPRFYRKIYQIKEPEEYEKIKDRTRKYMRTKKHDNTPERLQQREKVKIAQISYLKRGLENDT